MKPPNSRVYVQQFELTISRILFELHFDKSIVVDSLQKAFCDFFDLGELYRLNIGSRPAKFSRMLAHSSRYQCTRCLAIAKKGTVRVLSRSIPWNDLLNQYL